MKLRYMGPGGGVTARLVGPYRWDVSTGYVQDVDAETAASLLTQPTTNFTPVSEFEIDADEPLLTIKGIGEQRAGELALFGVGSVRDLALLDKEGILRIATLSAVSEKQVRAWVSRAKMLMA